MCCKNICELRSKFFSLMVNFTMDDLFVYRIIVFAILLPPKKLFIVVQP